MSKRYCSSFDLGFGIASRFDAVSNSVLGLDYAFGFGFAPYACALCLLLLQKQKSIANVPLSNTILQCMIRGEFTATTAPLLPPGMHSSVNTYFSKTKMIAICAESMELQMSGRPLLAIVP